MDGIFLLLGNLKKEFIFLTAMLYLILVLGLIETLPFLRESFNQLGLFLLFFLCSSPVLKSQLKTTANERKSGLRLTKGIRKGEGGGFARSP